MVLSHCLVWVASLWLSQVAAISVRAQDKRLLNATAIKAHLTAGRALLGDYGDDVYCGNYPDWMEEHLDDTPLASLNIPGTRNSPSWSYTEATRKNSLNWTGTLGPSEFYRTQSRSLFQQLGDGIRVFDFGLGWLPGGSQVGFFNGPALLDNSTTLEDVLYGFYQYLVEYNTETVFISLRVDNTTFGNPNSTDIAEQVYSLLTDDVGKQFWMQDDAVVSTLAASRGKINLLRRMDWTSLNSSTHHNIGIPLLPSNWAVNNANFTIAYNATTNATMYIDDYTDIGRGDTLTQKVSTKLESTTAHLLSAAKSAKSNQLYMTFASSERLDNRVPITSQMLSAGNSTSPGVNEGLLTFIEDHAENRTGILMFDWYFNTTGLVDRFIDGQV